MSEELQACKRRAIEKIKAMRAVTAKEHDNRCEAYQRVRRREQNEYHRGLRSEAIHGFIIRERLHEMLEFFFAFVNTTAPDWVGTEPELIELIDLPDVPVVSHYEYLRRVAIDKYLGCTMLTLILWSFPRFAPRPSRYVKNPDMPAERPDIFK